MTLIKVCSVAVTVTVAVAVTVTMTMTMAMAVTVATTAARVRRMGRLVILVMSSMLRRIIPSINIPGQTTGEEIRQFRNTWDGQFIQLVPGQRRSPELMALMALMTLVVGLVSPTTTTMVLTSEGGKSTMAVRVRLAASILALLYAMGAEDVADFRGAVGLLVDPALDGVEHGAVGFVVHIAHGWVMEYAQAVADNLSLGGVGVFPCVEDARADVLHDGGGDVAGRLVEDVGEVVLG